MDELEAKKAQLMEKLDIKKEAAFEKDLVLEELASLSTRLHESAAAGKAKMVAATLRQHQIEVLNIEGYKLSWRMLTLRSPESEPVESLSRTEVVPLAF